MRENARHDCYLLRNVARVPRRCGRVGWLAVPPHLRRRSRSGGLVWSPVSWARRGGLLSAAPGWRRASSPVLGNGRGGRHPLTRSVVAVGAIVPAVPEARSGVSRASGTDGPLLAVR